MKIYSYSDEFCNKVIEFYKHNNRKKTCEEYGITQLGLQYIIDKLSFKKNKPKKERRMPSAEEFQANYNAMSHQALIKHYKLTHYEFTDWMKELKIIPKTKSQSHLQYKSQYHEMIDKAIHVKDIRALKFEVGKSYLVGNQNMECVQCTRDMVFFKREYLNSYGEKRTVTETYQKIDLMGVEG
jgi:hypothetical protein